MMSAAQRAGVAPGAREPAQRRLDRLAERESLARAEHRRVADLDVANAVRAPHRSTSSYGDALERVGRLHHRERDVEALRDSPRDCARRARTMCSAARRRSLPRHRLPVLARRARTASRRGGSHRGGSAARPWGAASSQARSITGAMSWRDSSASGSALRAAMTRTMAPATAGVERIEREPAAVGERAEAALELGRGGGVPLPHRVDHGRAGGDLASRAIHEHRDLRIRKSSRRRTRSGSAPD